MNPVTFLCPDCNGWGLTGGERLDVDDYAPEYPCIPCDESGVVHLSREIGEARGLQRWHGEQGRTATRGSRWVHEQRRGKRPPDRSLEDDVLRSMAKWRARAAAEVRNFGTDWRMTQYGWIRKNFAMKPVALPKPKGYLDRLMESDPVVAEILGPLVSAFFPEPMRRSA